MGWTKRQLVDQAFACIGIASYEFDLTDDERVSALFVLDAMLAEWEPRLRLGYKSAPPALSSLNDDSGLPDVANAAVYSNLATRIAPGFGKEVPQWVASMATNGYQLLLSARIELVPMQYPDSMPVGAGNRTFDSMGDPYFTQTDPLEQGKDGELTL